MRKLRRQRAKTFRLKSKERKGVLSRIGVKTLELNRREVNIANREAALVVDIAKRQAMVAAIINKVQESGASTSDNVGSIEDHAC